MLFLIIQALCLAVKGHNPTFVLKFARNAKGQGQRKEQKSKNPNSSFTKSWSLARGSVRAPGGKY